MISESARGEGAILLESKGRAVRQRTASARCRDESDPRGDGKEGVDHEFISFENVPRRSSRDIFPYIYEKCLEEGYDILKEPAPIVPAQHYFMGGVHVDRDSERLMPHLYAVGETSCNGVHGKNRFASNSLLRALFCKARRTKDRTSQKGKEEHESNYHAACC